MECPLDFHLKKRQKINEMNNEHKNDKGSNSNSNSIFQNVNIVTEEL